MPSIVAPDLWLREHSGVPEKIELGLDSCKKVLVELGLEKLPFKVISVAGTNGKGSTLAFLDAILSQAGYVTGRYTSPHLQQFNERILLAQEPVDDALIINAFEKIRTAAKEIQLTYFEFATLASLVIFAQKNIDIALLEVGLGGRLDAVNAVDADLSIITSIALDHQDWLGDNLNDIATEKAGIMRSGKPCILASENMPQSLHKHAHKLQVQLIELNKDYFYQIEDKHLENQSSISAWAWTYLDKTLRLPKPALSASIQLQNAAAAITAIHHLDIPIPDHSDIAHGLQSVSLPGRMQSVVARSREWVLDVAHNPAAMQVLVDSLLQNYSDVDSISVEKYPLQLKVVFSMLSDKDAKACIKLLKPCISEWFISPLDSPRSYTNNQLKDLLVSEGVEPNNIYTSDSIAEACELASNHSVKQQVILVCGSFYTVGSGLDYLYSARV